MGKSRSQAASCTASIFHRYSEATASEDYTARLWSRTNAYQKIVVEQNAGVASVRFSPDGQHIATAGMDGTIQLLSLQGDEPRIMKGHDDWVVDVAFSPDGAYSGDSDHLFWFYSITDPSNAMGPIVSL